MLSSNVVRLEEQITVQVARDTITTLTDFVRRSERSFRGTRGRLTNIILSIALGGKIVSRAVTRCGLSSLHGATGDTNVQGEQVQKLDVYADQVFSSVLGRCEEFLSMVSEEQELIIQAENGHANSEYVIAFDPLDGSSNIDCNVSIGTIWAIYKRVTTGSDRAREEDFFRAGRKIVAAGYLVYGSSVMFVYSTGAGSGVNGFTLDQQIGEFVLTHPNMKMPVNGSSYSCNQANSRGWSSGVNKIVDGLNSQEKKFSLRYIGSLVADFHRILLKGGLFMYPADNKNKSGKLRLLYECIPLAYLAEHAGGKASNGKCAILDIVPKDIHERTPLFIGSASLVDFVEQTLRDE